MKCLEFNFNQSYKKSLLRIALIISVIMFKIHKNYIISKFNFGINFGTGSFALLKIKLSQKLI